MVLLPLSEPVSGDGVYHPESLHTENGDDAMMHLNLTAMVASTISLPSNIHLVLLTNTSSRSLMNGSMAYTPVLLETISLHRMFGNSRIA